MASARTIVATGASSGLGLEAIKQILATSQTYSVVAGARDVDGTRAAYDGLPRGSTASRHHVLPLQLASLDSVRSFARQTLDHLGAARLDYLFLNAAISNGADKPGPDGSPWCEALVVNHLSQHYLVHLLREKLVASQSRLVFVSSGAVRMVQDLDTLDADLRGGSGASGMTVYPETKFVQLLGAQWWRRQLAGLCRVVAVSPGLIPGTGLGRGANMTFTMDMKDAKPVSVGGASLVSAFFRDDFPDDPERIFLTSWGEWWPKSEYAKALDERLQDKWNPGREEVEAGFEGK